MAWRGRFPGFRSAASLEADLRADLPDVLSAHGMGAFLWDLASDRIVLDRGALAVFGLRRDQFDGSVAALDERIVAGSYAGLREWAAEAVESAGAPGLSIRARDPGGRPSHGYVDAVVRRDASGRAVRLVGVVRNVGVLPPDPADPAGGRRRSDVVQVTTNALARALTFEDVLNAVNSDEVLETLDAAGLALSVLEHGGRPLVTTKGRPESVFDDFHVLGVEEALPITDAIREGTLLVLGREEVRTRYPKVWTYIERTSLTSAVIMPLRAHGRAVGALTLLYEGRERLGTEDRNLLTALGAAVAQSLERARLYDEEHALAVGFQQAMLPARIPRVAGLGIEARYQPAGHGQEVGGDWYDVVPLPDGHIGFVVGDVEGHDVEAAATMGQLRTALRAYAREGHPPATVVDQASAYLDDLTDRLATCVYADLDPVSGETLVVRAGHPEPLLRLADRHTSPLAVAGGLPLGAPELRTAPYPTTHHVLGTGEILLLCTDGLLESRHTDLDTGVGRLCCIVSAGPDDLGPLAGHIVEQAWPGGQPDDDVALLLVSRRPPSAR